MRQPRWQAPALLLCFALACGPDSVAPVAPPLSRLELRHQTRTVAVADEITLQAAAFDKGNRPASVPVLEWTSDDPSIATVDQGGRIVGKNIGLVTIRASAGGLAASIGISVRAARLSVTLQSGSAILTPGQAAVLKAVLLDAYGRPIPGGPSLNWSTADRGIITVRRTATLPDGHIEVTAASPGIALITAGIEGTFGDYVMAVVPSTTSADSALMVTTLSFVEFLDLSDRYAYGPTIRVAVVPGRSVEVMRVEVAIAGLSRATYPALCSASRLAAGQHDLLGPGSYPYDFDFAGATAFPLADAEGVALITYRAEDGSVRIQAARGEVDTWGYDWVSADVPWKLCGPS